MVFNQNLTDSAILAAIESSLSPERFQTYVRASADDRSEALRLYTWNTAVSAAFYGPLQGLEIVLRNAMHRELTASHGPTWYDDARVGLDSGALDRIRAARQDLQRSGYAVDAPHLVAALPFGFWISLLGRGGRSISVGAPKQDYEMSLWRPTLYRAFPNIRARRSEIHRRLDYLRTFRNRIAHHEPIFARHLTADYESILLVTGWISSEVRDWISHHSRVIQLLSLPRNEAAVTF